jgi:hypothetical protein
LEEKLYCPDCGEANDIDNNFCNSCGASLEEAKKVPTQPESTITQSTQQPKRVYTKEVEPTTIEGSEIVFKIFVFMGLIIALVSITVFSWLGWFFWLEWGIYLWMPILFMGISLLGIVFSSIGLKGNIAIGIIGLIAGIIGSLIQTVLVGITIYVWVHS